MSHCVLHFEFLSFSTTWKYLTILLSRYFHGYQQRLFASSNQLVSHSPNFQKNPLLKQNRPSDKFKDMQKEPRMLLKLMVDCFLQKGGGTDTVSVEHRVSLYNLIMFEKVNLPRYISNHMIWALKES